MKSLIFCKVLLIIAHRFPYDICYNLEPRKEDSNLKFYVSIERFTILEDILPLELEILNFYNSEILLNPLKSNNLEF